MAGLKQYNLLVIRDIKQGYIKTESNRMGK